MRFEAVLSLASEMALAFGSVQNDSPSVTLSSHPRQRLSVIRFSPVPLQARQVGRIPLV